MFCWICGADLILSNIENRKREVCINCGWVYYPQLEVSSAAILSSNNKIFLLKRADNPWKTDWYLPGGHVENDEDPKMAAEFGDDEDWVEDADGNFVPKSEA